MRTIILYILISIFLFSCKNQNSENKMNGSYTFEPAKDNIYIKLGKREVNYTSLNQYFSDKDSNYLAFLNENHNSICIYNLDNQSLLKEIEIEKEGINAFPGKFGFVVKNLDTIILISNWPPKIGLLNREGEIIKRISCEKDENGKWLSFAISLWGQKAILTGNELYVIQELAVRQYSGKLTSADQKQLKAAVTINIVNGNVKLLPLNYPDQLVGKDIFNMSKCWEKGYNNCFIYSFSIMSDLFVTQDFADYRKIPIETDYQLKLPENMFKYSTDLTGFLKYEMETDAIRNLYYDKYRECYYILVRKRETDINQNEPSRTNSLYPDCFIIILDKDFKHLSDIHFPKNTYSFNNMFITKEGLYISEDNVNNHSFSEDAMRFRLFKLKKN